MRSTSVAGCILAAAMTAGAALAAGGNPLSFGKPDFELTGRVYDDDTKEPIEGAYVVALYYEGYSSFAAVGRRCKRAKGMYTGKDGTFHFPVEKLDGDNPGMVMAIKPGYFSLWAVIPETEAWRKQTKAAYTGRDLPLKKQDPANPSWQLGHSDVFCNYADSRADVEPAIVFLSISLDEETRLKFSRQRIEATSMAIDHLKNLSPRGRKP